MNRNLKQKLEDIFCSALEIHLPDQRKTFLDRECRGDTKLRAKVQEMLARQPAVEEYFRRVNVDRLLVKEFSDQTKKVETHGQAAK